LPRLRNGKSAQSTRQVGSKECSAVTVLLAAYFLFWRSDLGPGSKDQSSGVHGQNVEQSALEPDSRQPMRRTPALLGRFAVSHDHLQ